MFGKSTAFHRLTRFKSKGQTFLIFIKIKRFFYHFFSNIITLNKLSILTIASSVEQVYTFYVHISIRIPILIVIENNYNLLEMLQQFSNSSFKPAYRNRHFYNKTELTFSIYYMYYNIKLLPLRIHLYIAQNFNKA